MMFALRRHAGRLSLLSLTVIAACSTPKAPPPAPPPPVVETVRPRPPMGAAEGMSLPQKADDGSYLTPNRGITSNTALWHVRMALNVAALSCRDAQDQARSQYNQILHVHKAILTEANAAVDRNYKIAYGRFGLNQREDLNTVVYNFFALPPVTKSFCPVAIAVGAKMLAMPSGELLGYAPQALAELEKPFQDFYAAYADYLRRLAEWQARFGGTVTVVVSPTPLPPPPKPPGEAPPEGFTPSLSGTIGQTLPAASLPAASGPAASAPVATPGAAPLIQPYALTPAPPATPPLPNSTPAAAAPAPSAPRLTVEPLPATP